MSEKAHAHPSQLTVILTKLYGGTGPKYLNMSRVVELVAEPAHRVVELEPVLPVHEKGGVHYHAFAHALFRPWLVNERSNASENRLLIARALLRQGVLDLLTKADALIVRFRRRTSVEGVAHPANRLVLPHHFGHRGALVPERLEPHLDPAAHLLE